MKLPKLVISGSIAMDRLMTFSSSFSDMIEPEKIDILSISILMDSLKSVNGGTAANISNNLAQLGVNPVLLGSIGDDGESYLASLAKNGVDTNYVYKSDLPTATFTVFTDKDENQVGGFYPGAMVDSIKTNLKPWKDTDALVCVSANDPASMRQLVKESSEYGLRLFYDPGQQTNNISGADLKAGCDAAHILIVNEYELGVISTKTGYTEDELKQNIDIFITTKGVKGSVIEGKTVQEPIYVKAATADGVEDPTGAGDGFRAGFLFGYIRQWGLEASAELGAVVSSFIVEEFGTQDFLSKASIMERYKKEFNKEITIK